MLFKPNNIKLVILANIYQLFLKVFSVYIGVVSKTEKRPLNLRQLH